MMSTFLKRTLGPTCCASWAHVPPKGARPPAACCHSLTNYKNQSLILFGGGSTELISNRVYVFDLQTEAWREVPTINSEIVQPRVSHSAVIYEDKLIVYGGQDLHNPILYGDVLELDLKTWVWSAVHTAPSEPEGPGERRLHSAHVHGSRMYVVMGDFCHTSTVVWYLDLTDYTWHPVPSVLRSHSGSAHPFEMAMVPLSGHCAAVEGDTLYLFGGYAVSEATGSNVLYSSSLFQFDFESAEWAEVAVASGPRPYPRYASSMAVRDGKVYIFGGDANRSTMTAYFDDFWVLDTRAAPPRWRVVTYRPQCRAPTARSGHSYAVARNTLYIMGGEVPVADDVQYSAQLYRYPLGLSMDLSLRQNAALQIAASLPTRDTASLLPLSYGARQALQWAMGTVVSSSSDDFSLSQDTPTKCDLLLL
ncbi:kelch domain-containing protein 3 [Strigomonas culicis]|uniref:Kelch domain-containing protein 3 n=1 Tax=Strigomonas culicis TaxID=28005 RepID=S9U1P4_9TRYP|nr:kelch domain-containing protein 3 [Strigomonas culicis]|eukprot:EPY24642.1 kelch domain-containing protein 3 [Strigomonas culicis]